MTKSSRGLWNGVLRVTALLFLFPLGCAFAQSARLAEKARESIVYIYFDAVDPQTGAKGHVQGTGFVVSPAGYVLTAAHLFRLWHTQTDVSKVANPIRATRYDKPGYTQLSPLILEPVNLGDANTDDIALLKLPNLGHAYETAPICLDAGDRIHIGDSFMSFGFPADQNFQPIPGVFGTQNAPGGRWAATSAFTEGMSGGPIYGGDGTVVGIIKGGLTNTDAVRYITPIRHATTRLIAGGAADKCVTAGVASSEPTSSAEDLLWTFLLENYSSQSAANFLRRFPNSKRRAELETRMASTAVTAAAAAAKVPGTLTTEKDQYWTFELGKPRSIPVCWESTDRYAAEREWVRTAIGESWELFSSVRFVGWDKCQPNQRAVRVAVSDSPPHAKALGPKVLAMSDGVVLNFEFEKWSSTCKARRESCIRGTAVHEFGHVLGFFHENERPDTPEACRQLASGAAFAGKLITPYDPASVMNNCNPIFANNGVLSSLDREKVRIIYGAPAAL